MPRSLCRTIRECARMIVEAEAACRSRELGSVYRRNQSRKLRLLPACLSRCNVLCSAARGDPNPGCAFPGSESHGKYRQQPPPTDGTGWSNNFWGFFGKKGVEGLVETVKEKLYASDALEIDKSTTEDLPRFRVYHDTVLGPPMTKSEEIELKLHLEHILRQVQYSVKLMGLQPVELHDVEIIQPSPSKPGAAIRFHPSLIKRRMEHRKTPLTGSRNFEAELEKKELQNAELIAAYEKFIAQFKLFIAASLDNNHISPEFANDLRYIVECYSKNVQMALKAGGNLLTLKCLIGRIDMFDKANSWLDSCKMVGSLAIFVVTVIDGAIQSVGSSPIQFSSIGKQANRILDLDFTFDKLRLNCDTYKKVSFGAGCQTGGQQTISELLLKCKDESNLFSINFKAISENNIAADGGAAVPDNDMVETRISLSKICGSDTRCVLKMPFPSLNGKFEVRHGIPYAVCAGGVDMVPNPDGPIPVLDFSIVGGIKFMGLGAHFQLREGQISSTLGMSFTSDLLALGLTCKSPSNYNATIWKKVVDSSTTIAARATYRPPAGENEAPPADGVLPGFRYTLGVKRAVDPTLYLKARVGTDWS